MNTTTSTPNNNSIVRDVRIMSEGAIEMDASALQTMRHNYHRRPQQRNQKGRNPKRNSNNGRSKQHSKFQPRYHNNSGSHPSNNHGGNNHTNNNTRK